MQIPLFPLHTVLAPGIALPLHIFEERYRTMVKRCLDTSSPFGIVLIREVLSGRRPYLVADVAVLTEDVGDRDLSERLAMRATRRFVRYLELLQPRDGETAEEIDVRVEVEAADDDDPGADETPENVGGELEDDSGTEGDASPRRRRVTIPDDPTILSYLLAGILQVEPPRRQALLEMATTEARLRDLLQLIEREVLLLEKRLRFYRPDGNISGPRRS